MKQCLCAPCVLVCVTDQFSCERLIKQGKKIADEYKLPLRVLNVSHTNNGYNVNSTAIEHLYNVSKQHNASMSVIYNDETALITAGFIRKNYVKAVVTGAPKIIGMGFIYELHNYVPDVNIYMLSTSNNIIHEISPSVIKLNDPTLA